MKKNFKNKNVLIIGGLGLIGSAVTEKFLFEGSSVICVDIQNENSYLKEFKKNKKFRYIKYDISKIKNVNKFFEILDKFTTPDIFVNCSYPRQRDFDQSYFEKLNYKNYSKHIDSHLNSYVWISKTIAEKMKNSKIRGSIINLSSIYGIVAQDMSLYHGTEIRENLTYSVIKTGIIGSTKLIASKFGKYGIRANCICPSGIERKDKYSKRILNKKFRKNFLQRVPLKRFATADDVANAVIFLSSNKASYITGVSLPVDGGWTAI